MVGVYLFVSLQGKHRQYKKNLSPFPVVIKNESTMESETRESQMIKKKAGFIARLFRGEISLPITYWFFGVLIGNVAFQIILKLIFDS